MRTEQRLALMDELKIQRVQRCIRLFTQRDSFIIDFQEERAAKIIRAFLAKQRLQDEVFGRMR